MAPFTLHRCYQTWQHLHHIEVPKNGNLYFRKKSQKLDIFSKSKSCQCWQHLDLQKLPMLATSVSCQVWQPLSVAKFGNLFQLPSLELPALVNSRSCQTAQPCRCFVQYIHCLPANYSYLRPIYRVIFSVHFLHRI